VGLAGLWGVFAEHLVGLGDYEIWGNVYSEGSLEASPVKDKIHFVKANFQDRGAGDSVIREVKPGLCITWRRRQMCG